MRIHGHAARDIESRTYKSWENMIQRCTNPNQPNWARYGGRGIGVCESWRSFSNFLADMGERPEGKSIDRIDNDCDYEKANCKWSTHLEQQQNRSAKSGPPRKTYCIRGHELRDLPVGTHRGCLICKRQLWRERTYASHR